MATVRTTKVVRVLVPTPAGTDSQTYAEVQLLAGSNVTLTTSASNNRAAVTIASTGGGGGGGGAPTTAEYLVKSSDATLSAERVVGSSSNIAPDWSVSGAVTFGVAVASEARGDLLMRGASTWGRLAPGTSGYALVSAGAGADLGWSRMQPYDAGTLTSLTAGTWTGATSITTLGTVTTGTWSASTIAVNKGGTGLTSYTAGDVLYATGTSTLGTTTSTTTGRSILALGAPPVGYVLGNSGSGLAWVAATVYIASVRLPDVGAVIDQNTSPAIITTSTGTIGGP
ncbi:hypothetical protein [Janthinobacterium sp.]|uniref:hypothetical protein n=1 Tax=Janthinobacterium sp. TaxID=1871054 RepID=UPI0025C0B145|nr:hypothetical protein [Janthinobacterium sp.]NBV20313.1 hypothetical protein [Janthinobacterium sp.]